MSDTVTVAAIDCGTNSARLLIAQVDGAAGTLTDLDRRMEIVRLGEGVDRTGLISPQALERTLAVTKFYAALCADAGVQRVRFVATSASRDAANRDHFVAGVRELLGVEPEVITGAEEAALSFAGATRGVLGDAGAGGDPGEALVVDIGGGSTEVVLGEPAGTRHAAGGTAAVAASISVDVGCVRLTERHLTGDPATAEQLAAATADVDAALDLVGSAVPVERARSVIGVAGSVTTVTAHVLGLPEYDSARIHAARLPIEDVVRACGELISMTRADRAALPYMHPGRVDVIGAGALVWQRLLARIQEAAGLTEVITSEHDILDGIAWSLADQ